MLIFSKRKEEHVELVQQVMHLFGKHCLKIKMEKCLFDRTQVYLLIQIINKKGVRRYPEKIEANRKIPVPRSAGEICSVLGIASYTYDLSLD